MELWVLHCCRLNLIEWSIQHPSKVWREVTTGYSKTEERSWLNSWYSITQLNSPGRKCRHLFFDHQWLMLLLSILFPAHPTQPWCKDFNYLKESAAMSWIFQTHQEIFGSLLYSEMYHCLTSDKQVLHGPSWQRWPTHQNPHIPWMSHWLQSIFLSTATSW